MIILDMRLHIPSMVFERPALRSHAWNGDLATPANDFPQHTLSTVAHVVSYDSRKEKIRAQCDSVRYT